MLERFEQPKKPDFKPLVEKLENGQARYTIRVRRPEAKSRQVKSAEDRKKQTRDGYLYSQDVYNYENLMGEVGSPESIEMKEPKLEMAFVRHLKHTDNVVPEEAKRDFEPRVERLLDSLGITDKTKVFIVNSDTGQFRATGEGFARDKRAEQTAGVIAKKLDEMGVSYQWNDIDGEGTEGITPLLQSDLREFPEDETAFEEAMRKFKANAAAKKAGEELPYPDAPKVPPVVQASFAENVKELEAQTGIQEVASATVARNLHGFDRIEQHFLKGEGLKELEDSDKIVVIIVAHGQMGSDITEAFVDVTDKKMPFIFAENGGYWRVNVGEDQSGQKIEEYIFETGSAETGMVEME